ncbi:MATE efflux family protein 1 [Acorus gramineus]|uniref:MATE efflux family protein 1 n=1 Tax=Acorus gramineus TaxID=55184 RepID=A0AAV9AT67_ACOGR|nr:MATE efflux family protein 1 [Acorus gramineus]
MKRDELGLEIAQIALPAALALTADPIASLIDTAFIGQIGPIELAAVGVSIAVFNQVSRIAIFPLVSVTTSFVAEEDSSCSATYVEQVTKDMERALSENCEMKDLTLCEDSHTNVYDPLLYDSKNTDMPEISNEKKHIPSVSTALVVGGVLGLLQAILLVFGARPALMFMGVKSDSPMLTPACQYLTLRSLGAPAVLLSLAMQGVFRGFKDTKTPLYATASMAARQGSVPMAAFQICLQIWLATSLLADGLAVAGQAILANAFARRDHEKATSAASRVLQFVAVTQPINALAFVFDGINFGASDFAYSAYSMDRDCKWTLDVP